MRLPPPGPASCAAPALPARRGPRRSPAVSRVGHRPTL